jgi:hypothetical protein
MKHVEWTGLAQHDTIFPLFLFLAGVSWPFSLGSQLDRGRSVSRIQVKIAVRTAILFLLGFSFGGVLKFKPDFRLMGVLQYIGLSWGFAATAWLHIRRKSVLAALAAVTAPTSTAVTIRQTGAKGVFVNTLLQTMALDGIFGLAAYSVALSLAMSLLSPGGGVALGDVLFPLVANLGALLLGGVFGILMKWLMPTKRSTDNRLIISVSLLAAFCGVCAVLNISPLLGCMSMGTVYINTTDDSKLFKQLGYFSPPILLIFFVCSGLRFDLGALFSTAGGIGGSSLLVVGVSYFAVRIVGKYIGAFLGCKLVRLPAKVCNNLGLALIPQAGVAIGLAAIGARTLGGEVGSALHTVILTAGILYELVGPALAKLALYLSGSYSEKLEDLVPAETIPQGETLSEAELLIRRIRKIQETLPPPHEEEQAFTEAAEEHWEAYRYRRGRFGFRR